MFFNNVVRSASASRPRLQARASTSERTARAAASRLASPRQLGSPAALSMSVPVGSFPIPSEASWLATRLRPCSEPAHSRQSSAGTDIVCSWSSCKSWPRVIHRRPEAGSITWATPAARLQMIAKCVLPFGSRVTAIQGSDPASSRSTRSFGRSTCSTGTPSSPAMAWSVSIDVPSTSVWHASRRRP